MSVVCAWPAVGHGRMFVTLRRPETQRCVASCSQLSSVFRFRYVGLNCELIGRFFVACISVVSLLQFLL